MRCENIEKVHAYHDGQLLSIESAAFEVHLRSCGDCQAELAEVRSLSVFMQKVSLPDADAHLMERLHGAVEDARDFGIVRFAEFLSAAAAVILVIGASFLFVNQSSSPAEGSTNGNWAEYAMGNTVDSNASSETNQWVGAMTGESQTKNPTE